MNKIIFNSFKFIYCGLTWALSTTFLSLLAGMISGIAINIATGGEISDLMKQAIAVFLGSVACLFTLTIIREKIQAGYASRSGIPGSKWKTWQTSADFRNKTRVTIFFTSLALCVFLTITGINKMAQSNAKKTKEDYVKENKLNGLLERIERREDSIQKLLQTPVMPPVRQPQTASSAKCKEKAATRTL